MNNIPLVGCRDDENRLETAAGLRNQPLNPESSVKRIALETDSTTEERVKTGRSIGRYSAAKLL